MDSLNRSNLFPIHPKNKAEAVASESGYGLAFHRAGINVDYMEELCNTRIDETKDYTYFDKERPYRL